MTHVVRLSRFFKHLLTFFVHFAHGGFVMLGAIVMALCSYQVIQFGPAGLDPRSAFGYKQTADLYATDDVATAEAAMEEASVSENASGMPAGYARVATAIAKRHRVSPVVVETLVQAAIREGRSNGIDPMLILAVITVESRFNPFAESAFGAQGLMQIIPRFHVEKIASEKGATALFDPIENIRVGTMILKNYIRSTGSVDAGLQMYGGASADPDMSYATKVQGELERLRALAHSGGSLRTATRSVAEPQA